MRSKTVFIVTPRFWKEYPFFGKFIYNVKSAGTKLATAGATAGRRDGDVIKCIKILSAVYETGDGGAARSSDARAAVERWRRGATRTN